MINSPVLRGFLRRVCLWDVKISGIVLGGFIGQLADGISWLKWMNYGQSFGLDTPLVIDFGLLVITFGLTIKITMASIIGVAVALFIYKMI